MTTQAGELNATALTSSPAMSEGKGLLDPSLRQLTELLSVNSVKDITPLQTQELVSIYADEDVESAFNTLMQKKVHGAPVVDRVTGECYGILDMKDFVSYLVFLHDKHTNPAFTETKATSLVDFAKQNQFKALTTNAPVVDVLRNLVELRLHRFPIVSDEAPQKVVKMISQTTIVEWLWENRISLSRGILVPLMEFEEAVVKPLYSVQSQAKVADALRLMVSRKITGVAVLDSTGTIVLGHITTTNLLPTIRDNYAMLDHPVSVFLEKSERMEVPDQFFAVPISSSLLDVLKLMMEHKVGRVYILDKQGKPKGVVTTTDMIDAIVGLSIATILFPLV